MILGKDCFKAINYSDDLSLENSVCGSSSNVQQGKIDVYFSNHQIKDVYTQYIYLGTGLWLSLNLHVFEV